MNSLKGFFSKEAVDGFKALQSCQQERVNIVIMKCDFDINFILLTH